MNTNGRLIQNSSLLNKTRDVAYILSKLLPEDTVSIYGPDKAGLSKGIYDVLQHFGSSFEATRTATCNTLG